MSTASFLPTLLHSILLSLAVPATTEAPCTFMYVCKIKCLSSLVANICNSDKSSSCLGFTSYIPPAAGFKATLIDKPVKLSRCVFNSLASTLLVSNLLIPGFSPAEKHGSNLLHFNALVALNVLQPLGDHKLCHKLRQLRAARVAYPSQQLGVAQT